MRLSSRLLATPDEFECFQKHYTEFSQVSISTDYLLRSRVRGFFAGADRMVGGYIINLHPPFRYAALVPNLYDAGHNGRFLADNERHFCEWTCMWIAPEISTGHRTRIYWLGILEMLWSGKRYVLAGTCHRSVMLRHAVLLDQLIYHGRADGLNGAEIYLYYGERRSIARKVGPAAIHYCRTRKTTRVAPSALESAAEIRVQRAG